MQKIENWKILNTSEIILLCGQIILLDSIFTIAKGEKSDQI